MGAQVTIAPFAKLSACYKMLGMMSLVQFIAKIQPMSSFSSQTELPQTLTALWSITKSILIARQPTTRSTFLLTVLGQVRIPLF